MRMNKLYKAMFALVAAGTVVPVAPAVAAPDPGPGWVLTGQRTVRNWVPEAGSGWVLVGQRQVTEFVADPVTAPLPPGANGAGHWEMVSFRDRSEFVADSAMSRKLANSSTAYRYVVGSPATQGFADEKVVVSKTPREVRTDLKNPYRETLNAGIYSVTKLVRSDKWNDVQYQTPVYNMKQKQFQTTNYFNFEWTDGIYGTLMREPDPKSDVGAWTNTGAIERDGLARYDLWPNLVKEDSTTANVEVTLARVPLSLASADAAKAKSATFLSDSGSGGSTTAVAGSQKRAVFKADDAIVSDSKPVEVANSGGVKVDELPSTGVVVRPTPTPAPTQAPSQGTAANPKPTPTPAPKDPQQVLADLLNDKIRVEEMQEIVGKYVWAGEQQGDEDLAKSVKLVGRWNQTTGLYAIYAYKGKDAKLIQTGKKLATSNSRLVILDKFEVGKQKLTFYINNPRSSSWDPIIESTSALDTFLDWLF